LKVSAKKLLAIAFVSVMVFGVFAGIMVDVLLYTDFTLNVTYNSYSISRYPYGEAQVTLYDATGRIVERSGITVGGQITFAHVYNGQYVLSVKWLILPQRNYTILVAGRTQTKTVDLALP